MEINLRALRLRASANEGLVRYEHVARLLTGKVHCTADEGVAWVRELVVALQVPPLGSYGISSAHSAALVDQASKASSMKANPIALTRDEMTEALERAL
jgi:alcohol dehydrogenase class IV